MAITLADFDKIWASTSPLTPYSFSESNYKQGWNFIGSTPPARQMWDFLQKNNDEKMQYLANNYLPLTGGTLTGAINTKRINNKFDFSKGTTPSSTKFSSLYFTDKDGDGFGANCLGLLETSVDANNLTRTYMRALRNQAESTTSCEISCNVDNDGNIYTSAPTPANGDNSPKIATTAFVHNNYLPLSGGTMSGTIDTSAEISFRQTADDKQTDILGGSANLHGAGVYLFGKSHNNGGSFAVRAADSDNNYKDLIGKPNGDLTWDGNIYPSGYSMDNNEIKYMVWEGETTHNFIVYQAQLIGDSCHFIDVFIARSGGASSVACKLVLSCWNRGLPLFESFGDVLNGLSNTTIFAKVDNYVLTVYMSTRIYDKGYFRGVSAGGANVIRTEIGQSVAEIPTGASTPTRRV